MRAGTKKQSKSLAVLQIVLPSPLRHHFDYLPAPGLSINNYQIGQRVEAPFGRRKMIGLVIGHQNNSAIKPEALKAVSTPLDPEPLLKNHEIEFLQWIAHYYQHSVGDTIFSLIPAFFSKSLTKHPYTEDFWSITTHGQGLPADALKRAPKQQQLLKLLRENEMDISNKRIKAQGFSSTVVRELANKELISASQKHCHPIDNQYLRKGSGTQSALVLSSEQSQSLTPTLDALAHNAKFHVNLIHGITGSGKTEVYLQATKRALEQEKQVLVLVPEISLTPQTLKRFTLRLNCNIAISHSGLNDKERAAAWLAMRSGEADIMLGTRSAVATPMAKPGLIIVDEEHDNSYKQQEGLRYSARDAAISRANKLNIPVILGSATPSLESLQNAQSGKYHLSSLQSRNTGGKLANIEITDTRKLALSGGLSEQAINIIGQTLAHKKQALVFINRRGYAPQLLCHDCGWYYSCPHCDAKLTYHKQRHSLRCHHCSFSCKPSNRCQRCQSTQVQTVGEGTEQCEETLSRLFTGTPLIRVDRDTVSTNTLLHEALDKIHQHPSAIIVGTQMLAKGHHFPNLETVVMLNVDSGLYGTDFRSIEKTLQLLTQVTGRAGRASQNGRVLIQTHLPDHPQLLTWHKHGYGEAALELLRERQLRGLPPFGFLASIGADGKQPNSAQQFLVQARQQFAHMREQLSLDPQQIEIIGPFPALMERRAGRHRAHLLLKAAERKVLQRCLQQTVPLIDQLPKKSDLRWQIDVDPQSTI